MSVAAENKTCFVCSGQPCTIHNAGEDAMGFILENLCTWCTHNSIDILWTREYVISDSRISDDIKYDQTRRDVYREIVEIY